MNFQQRIFVRFVWELRILIKTPKNRSFPACRPSKDDSLGGYGGFVLPPEQIIPTAQVKDEKGKEICKSFFSLIPFLLSSRRPLSSTVWWPRSSSGNSDTWGKRGRGAGNPPHSRPPLPHFCSAEEDLDYQQRFGPSSGSFFRHYSICKDSTFISPHLDNMEKRRNIKMVLCVHSPVRDV